MCFVRADIRPPLDTLAVCMGLPQREATFDKTRVEALAIALVLATALAFSAYRMVILRRCVQRRCGSRRCTCRRRSVTLTPALRCVVGSCCRNRFGDFSFGVTVADHTVFWFGFISGLFDVVSRA